MSQAKWREAMKHSAAAFQAARPADTPVDAERLPHACRTWGPNAAQRSELDADLRSALSLHDTCHVGTTWSMSCRMRNGHVA
jgi:hypothetical protein